MSEERIFIAKSLANKLWALEDAIDKAITGAAGFAANLPEARTQMRMSAVVGQDVFDSAIATIAALNDARRHAVEMHNRMEATRVQMGMRPVAFGSACDKPHVARDVKLVDVKSTQAA